MIKILHYWIHKSGSYGNIMQGQIADMEDSRSFVSVDVSIS